MEIYILSSGRPKAQITWDNLPPAIQQQTQIVVPFDEQQAYKGFPILSGPEIVRDVAKTRQWLIDHSAGKIVMMDDDLVFATRRTDDPSRFTASTPTEIEHMFHTIWSCLDNHVHAGVGSREGGNRRIERFCHTGRMTRILAYDAPALRQLGVRFDAVTLMEDFHVTLSLLRKGCDNIILNFIVHNQKASNAPGGCSQYRTKELQELAAHLLKEHHPDFVKVVQKQTKTAWNGEARTDVIVQWKRALGADI